MRSGLTIAAWLAISACVVLPIVRATAAEPDEVIREAREKLYTQRYVAIDILERAVEGSPHNADYWAEYIHALDVDGQFYFAERASREALRINPNHPTLLVARARILEPAPALEVLEILGSLPGHAEQTRRLEELVKLGLGVPRDWDHPHLYVSWADRLIYRKSWHRALDVLKTGLQKAEAARQKVERNEISEYHGHADPALMEALRARKAMVLAMLENFDQAMQLQAACGHPQVVIDGSYQGIADCLLDAGKPKLAIESFGDKVPEQGTPQRRLLAWACAESGDLERAEQLLEEGDTWAELLLLRALLADGRRQRALEIGAKLVKSIGRRQGNMGRGLLHYYRGAVSLEDHYVKAVEWLAESFPEKKQEITYAFGSRVEPMRPFLGIIPEGVPSSRLIPRLHDRLRRAGDQSEELDLRYQLAAACADAGRYAEAADVLKPEALRVNSLPDDSWTLGLNPTAYYWSIYRRRVDAEELHKKNPRLLASARVLLDDIQAARWNSALPDGRKPLPATVVADRLAAIGPGVLSSVIDDLAPNTISGLDRSPYVDVIRRVGGVQDVPLLLNVLCLVSLDRRAGEPAAAKFVIAEDLATETAIHTCLEELTGTKNPETDRLARVEFWARWWRKNAEKVISGEQETR